MPQPYTREQVEATYLNALILNRNANLPRDEHKRTAEDYTAWQRETFAMLLQARTLCQQTGFLDIIEFYNQAV